MKAAKPIATLSLDLDDKWSYLKTHGDAGWESYPSYLNILVPRVLDVLRRHCLRITFFLVGRDAAAPANRDLFRAIAAGHEVGNHSYHHEPWLQRYTPRQVEEEIVRAEEQIERTTGARPVGFRGPGFSLSAAALEVLARRGYLYDASTFPTFLIPLARAYYFMTARFGPEERRLRRTLGGTWEAGLRPIRPYRWRTPAGAVLEIPVTTMPLLRLPIHVSYVHCLGTFSPRLAILYFEWALRLCRWTKTPPSVLLHPTDFLGCDDTAGLNFFPGMSLPSQRKVALVGELLRRLTDQFSVIPLGQYAQELARTTNLPARQPDFAEEPCPPPSRLRQAG
jgi:peptidoglycan/xylan/chitin deacetylase (PgdA/CDA1 family)